MRRLATVGFLIAAAAVTVAAQGSFSITTTTLPPAIIGQPYSPATLQTSGDPGPMGWSIDGPAGFIVQAGSATTGLFCYVSCAGGPAVQGQPSQSPVTIIATSQTTGKTGFQNYTLLVVNPLQILTTSLPNANANQSYSISLQGSGGTGSYVWSILSGTLPQGIALDPFKGALSGTAPGVNGVYPFTIQLLDQATQQKATQALSITVINGISILTTSLPNATVNQPYSFQLQGTGQNLVWSVAQGSQLPQGFSLTQNGVISGVGTSAVAPPAFVVQLANAQFPSVLAKQTLTLLITLGPLGINELTLPSATQNVPYSTALTPTGGIPPYTWSLGTSNLQGLSIASSSGIISGTLTASGSFPVLVTLSDSTGATVTKNYTLNVGNAVTITTGSLPSGPPNVAYSTTLTAAGGSVPYHWSVLTGSLPTGLTLDDNGLIHGTPTVQGAFQFTVKVTDSVQGTATKAFTITIGTVQPLTITTSLIGASVGKPYSQTLTATGGTQPVTTWTITSGSLPAGLSLNQSNGAITGTPTVLGTTSFTIQALDSAGGTASKGFTITVASPVTISAADFTTSAGVAVSQTLTAGGGVPPYTFSVTSTGSLPGGLQLGASTGTISGAPNATGTFPVTLQAKDADGRTASASITITVTNLTLTIVVPASPGSGQQPGVGISIPAPAPGDINGTLTLAFASSVGGDDKLVAFQNGSRSITFTITKGNTTAPNVTVITGTVAGTITLTASVPGNPDVIKTIVIAPAVPVISQVVLQQVTGGLNVVVTGYSNTREVSSGSFTFTVSSGNTLSQATIPVTLSSAYAAWFGNSTSNTTGGQFKLTVPFSVTQGSAAAVTKVSVTLTNNQGTSPAVSSP